MENNDEIVLATSEFDAFGCHKMALVFYILFFCYGWIGGWAGSSLNISVGFAVGVAAAIFVGGVIHILLYCSAKNNKIILTNYKITGIYNRHLSLNIPIDSVSSVSKGHRKSLSITCAGNSYNIAFVGNRDNFCSQINELLRKRTQQTLKDASTIIYNHSNYDEIERLKQLLDAGVITQEDFDAKKKQLLGL